MECGTYFVAKSSQLASGQGKFCSISCGSKAFKRTDEAKIARAKAGQTYKKNLAAGKFKRKENLKGEESPFWKGGKNSPGAVYRRSAEALRAYRKKNPDKVREFASNRKQRKHGRLPRGTIKRLMELQKRKCAICRSNILKKYHVDHIMPLARGGLHEPLNLQLLCPPCNLRKSAKDPLKHAQELGFLL